MTTFRSLSLALACAAGSLLGSAPVWAATCQENFNALQKAVSAGDVGGVEKEFKNVQENLECPGQIVFMSRRRAALGILNVVNKKLTAKAANAEIEQLLIKAKEFNGSWEVADTLGRLYMEEKKYEQAALAFDASLDLLNNTDVTPDSGKNSNAKRGDNASKELTNRIKEVYARGEGARLLAAAKATPASGTRGLMGGSLGKRSFRGWTPERIALPIQFVFNKTDLTDKGREALDELVKLIEEDQITRFTLVGHTDEEGEKPFNLRLSKARAEAVGAALKNANRNLQIETKGEGEDAPYVHPERNQLSKDERNQIDRRVEFVRKEN